MLLFRSEEHLSRWLEGRGDERGGSMDVSTAWRLADAWYRDRLDPAWERPPVDEIEALFASLGLTDDFWKLT